MRKEEGVNRHLSIAIRWGFSFAVCTALFWLARYLVMGEVPAVDKVVLFREISEPYPTVLNLSLSISSEWDIVAMFVFGILAGAVVAELTNSNKTLKEHIDPGLFLALFFGTIAGSVIGLFGGIPTLIFGLVVVLTCWLVSGTLLMVRASEKQFLALARFFFLRA